MNIQNVKISCKRKQFVKKCISSYFLSNYELSYFNSYELFVSFFNRLIEVFTYFFNFKCFFIKKIHIAII